MFNKLMKRGDNIPVRKEESLAHFQRDLNRLFNDFFSDFGNFGGSTNWLTDSGFGFEPRVDISETEKDIHVHVELPGVDQKDVDVSLSRDALTIHGEKKTEHEEKDKNYYRMERSYGSFHRTIPLPCEVDDAKAEAKFKNGVLNISLPKSEAVQNSTKKIAVKSE